MAVVTTQMLTANGVAQLLGVSPATVRLWSKNGQIPEPITTPGGQYRWRAADIIPLIHPADIDTVTVHA